MHNICMDSFAYHKTRWESLSGPRPLYQLTDSCVNIALSRFCSGLRLASENSRLVFHLAVKACNRVFSASHKSTFIDVSATRCTYLLCLFDFCIVLFIFTYALCFCFYYFRCCMQLHCCCTF